ncbi:hypothetical protein F3Y22_tig00111057pilonHSYRG00054 [Hibiscus syriacus]|uniref:RNase H type-1 domain-containing protein n=1 Tax=Hibiscus syriacus TaxID=106335 RepID=A0A6A2Z3M6_HIBSY|nr:hypothetical protein F3Y22_tig00111057pilonHSYRG00054 [Hibiscus syriacus]
MGGTHQTGFKHFGNNKLHRANVIWALPPIGWVKLNVDGARSSSTGLVACGGVLGDSNGNWMGGDSPSSHGVDGCHFIFWSLRLGRGSGVAARRLSAAAWKLGRRRVALGYQTLGFLSGTMWTVGSCQIQRL